MKLFWWLHRIFVHAVVLCAVYTAADRLALAAGEKRTATIAHNQRIEKSKAEMQARFEARYQQLKQAGVFDDRTTILSQASR